MALIVTNRRLALFGALLLAVGESALAPAMAGAQATVVPLKLYYSEIRTDNFTSAEESATRSPTATDLSGSRATSTRRPSPGLSP